MAAAVVAESWVVAAALPPKVNNYGWRDESRPDIGRQTNLSTSCGGGTVAGSLIDEVALDGQADGVLPVLRGESLRTSSTRESKELGVGDLSAYQGKLVVENFTAHTTIRTSTTREQQNLVTWGPTGVEVEACTGL
jgi:hypothetical protein